MSCSSNASPTAADKDQIFMKHRLQFADSLKDLKNLRKQLYSAADYFEWSYNRDNHKQFVVESSKEYVAKALVNTVDHLGSVADKLNKFLEEKANEYSATNTRFSCIQQRLCTIQGFVHSRGRFETQQDTGIHKHTILPAADLDALPLGKSNIVLYANGISSLPDDVNQAARRMKADPALRRKQESTREAAPIPNPSSFSFTKKEAERGRRSVSPLRLPFNLSITKRSVSPTQLILNKAQQRPSEGRRAISACRTREMRNCREMEEESYTKKSKHMLKALLSLHHSRKTNSTQTYTGITPTPKFN